MQMLREIIRKYEPIESLPDGLLVLMHAGDTYFYGYRIGNEIHQRGPKTDKLYRGVRPYEFKRLSDFERQRLSRTEVSR